MNILDIHTHNFHKRLSEAILNLHPRDLHNSFKETYLSLGLHPEGMGECNEKDIDVQCRLLERDAALKYVLAIGETGIDKLLAHDQEELEIQIYGFKKQALVAERLNKPVIIHCVKAFDEILQCKKEIKPQVPWIIHGFRKSEQMATQLVDHGLFLSYGVDYDENALKATPLDRMFFETDESKADIHDLYVKAAGILNMDVNELITKIQENIKKVFFP